MDPIIISLIVYYYWLYIQQRLNTRMLLSRKEILYTPESHNPIIKRVLSYDDTETRRQLRVSAKTFQEIALFLDKKCHGWSPELELMAFLLWLGSGTSYRMVSGVMDIPRSTINDIIHKMLNFTFDRIMPRVIRLPSASDLPDIGRKFGRRARTSIFNDCVAGAIDGTHIKISCPTHLHDQYINRKLDYSIQCQAICDANFRFLDIFVGYPGSVHDTRVLYNSPIFKKKLYPPPSWVLLGDSGYPCRLTPIGIITPFKENRLLTDTQKQFNIKHSKGRSAIECAFGHLKTRWRSIFNKQLELKIENCVKTVVSCCVFHNICIATNDNITIDWLTLEGPEPEIYQHLNGAIEENACSYRQRMADNL